MALTPEEIRAMYPLPAYSYKVTIDGETIAFSQVSGLRMSNDAYTYKESPTADGVGGPVTMRMPGQWQDVTVSLQKGVVRQRSVPVLYEWIRSTKLNMVRKKDIQVDLCDENGSPVIRWKVINAFPTSLESPTFDATANDAAIESMELMADYVQVEEI